MMLSKINPLKVTNWLKTNYFFCIYTIFKKIFFDQIQMNEKKNHIKNFQKKMI